MSQQEREAFLKEKSLEIQRVEQAKLERMQERKEREARLEKIREQKMKEEMAKS